MMNLSLDKESVGIKIPGVDFTNMFMQSTEIPKA